MTEGGRAGARTGMRNKAGSTQQPKSLTKIMQAALLQQNNAGGLTSQST